MFDDINERRLLALKRDAYLLKDLGFRIVESQEEATHYFDRDSKTWFNITGPVNCRRPWWLKLEQRSD